MNVEGGMLIAPEYTVSIGTGSYPFAFPVAVEEVKELEVENGLPVIGIDVSKFQAGNPEDKNPRKINWERAIEAGIKFAIIRCGSGTVEDWTYEYNRAECERLKIPFGVYHALYPRNNIEKQVEFFIQRFAGSIYPAGDIEHTGGLVKSELQARVKSYLFGLSEIRLPMVYTRATFWNEYVGQNYSRYSLWVAHYEVPKPTLPVGWNRYKFWQYSADGNGWGAFYGCQSEDVDIDRYYGSLEDFMSEFGVTEEPVPAPEQPVKKLRFRVGVPVLNVREGPGIQYADIGDLHGNDVVEVLNVNGPDAWIEIEPGKWACVTRGHMSYMTKLEE